MALSRVIPTLLVRGAQLVKTVRFESPKYVGDPMNVVRIFNDKEVDEIIVLDIAAGARGTGPDIGFVRDFASEAFMPVCIGGGVRTVDHFGALFDAGIEKVAVTSAAVTSPSVVRDAASTFGSQSVVVGIDVRRDKRGRATVHVDDGRRDTGLDPVEHAKAVQERGAGELLLTSIDREGTGSGYDLDLVRAVTTAVGIPVVAHGGAGDRNHLSDGLRAGASAVAAGSMFVFHGKHRAVLVSYLPFEAREGL